MRKAKFIGAAMALALTFSTGAGLIPQISSTAMTANAIEDKVAALKYFKVKSEIAPLIVNVHGVNKVVIMRKGETLRFMGIINGEYVKVNRLKTGETGWVMKKYITPINFFK